MYGKQIRKNGRKFPRRRYIKGDIYVTKFTREKFGTDGRDRGGVTS